MNGLSAALQSASILLREGLEALLVIAALAAFVKRAGVPEKVRPIYLGAALTVLASFGAALVFERFFEGEHNDFVEGWRHGGCGGADALRERLVVLAPGPHRYG